MTMTPPFTFEQLDNDCVEVTDGDRYTTRYTASPKGHYVFKVLASGELVQVCEKFKSRGPTLMVSGSLLETLEREYAGE